jgi:hypothetical protein
MSQSCQWAEGQLAWVLALVCPAICRTSTLAWSRKKAKGTLEVIMVSIRHFGSELAHENDQNLNIFEKDAEKRCLHNAIGNGSP